MAILKIARMGHPVLSRAAGQVDDPTAPDILRLIADMVDTLADAGGRRLGSAPGACPKTGGYFSCSREPGSCRRRIGSG